MRALAPITPAAVGEGDPFAADHPDIEVTRFLVPYFEYAPNLPAPDAYRRGEGREIAKRLPDLMTTEQPDIVFIGRESFGFHVPAHTGAVPCILRAAGGMTIGALGPLWSADRRRSLFEQLRNVTRVVAPAKHLADRLREAGLSNVELILNAVDLRQFSPRPPDRELQRQLGIDPGDIVVMHVSNMKALKRPQDIARSARDALTRNARLLYVIVGDGSERRPLEDLCRREGISARFRFVGWVDQARMPEIIALADLVVMPSEDETLARVYLETQACGRVLVASDISAAREVVDEGATGLLFRMGDADDLTAKTLLAAADERLRNEIGCRARKRVVAHDIEAALDAYLDLLERVSGAGAGGRRALFAAD